MSTEYQKKFCTTFNEPLSRHTTFKIGGPARVFAVPSDKEELKKILSLSRKDSIPYYILGNGSNLLVSDRGVDGIVIKLDGLFKHFDFRKNLLIAGGGIELASLRREACKKGLSGLEFTVGIPGTLGGAITMNAGADFSDNIGKLVKRVEIMDKCGRVKWLSHKEIDFGYRCTSIEKGSIILKAELKLKSASPVSIKKRTDSIWKKRKRSQPMREKSAGSIFKNPKNLGQSTKGQSPFFGAGFLIEKAGLKGKSCGKAYISPVHANFIVNRGNAKASDVTKLIKVAQREVFKQFGIKLELEIEIW